MISEFWITSRVGPENRRSRPRSMVMLATIETSTAGSTAMTENRLTICTCSRAAARPRRRACTNCQTSRMMMPTRNRMVVALISRKELTTWVVGSNGVSPVTTTKVRKADSSARATANGASHFRKGHPLGSATDESNDAAVVSALVIPTGVMVLHVRPPRTDAYISQCCRIATIRRRIERSKYHLNTREWTDCSPLVVSKYLHGSRSSAVARIFRTNQHRPIERDGLAFPMLS